jgi:hypothetical protein
MSQIQSATASPLASMSTIGVDHRITGGPATPQSPAPTAAPLGNFSPADRGAVAQQPRIEQLRAQCALEQIKGVADVLGSSDLSAAEKSERLLGARSELPSCLELEAEELMQSVKQSVDRLRDFQ